MWNLLAMALVMLAAPFVAAVEIRLPVEVPGAPGQFITVQAQTEGKVVRWVPLDGGLNLFPSELLRDSRYAVVTAAVNGRYRLLAYTAQGDEPSQPAVTVVVITGGPMPPGPVPPGPIPPGPTPPGPDPGPGPSPDAFTADMQRLYAADAAPDKAKARDSLAALYRQAAQTTVGDQRLTTVGDLFSALKQAADSVVAPNALRFVRERIGEEFSKTLPLKPDAVLDPATRSNAAVAFTRAARALEACK